MKRENILAIAGALVLVLALLLSMSTGAPSTVTAAPPAAQITPAASVNLSASDARTASFFNAEPITEDTRRCFDLAAYELLDVQYVVDQGTVTNTITLSLQHSNDNATFETGPALLSSSSADADAMTQRAIFGRYNCVFADVANSTAVTVTVIGVAK